jgi:hypothetical protein
LHSSLNYGGGSFNTNQEAELLCRFHELGEIHRLANIAVGAEVIAFNDILLLPRGSENDHGKSSGTLVCAQTLEHFQAIHLGQLQIQQDHGGHNAQVTPSIRSGPKQEIERLHTIARDNYFVRDVAFLKGEKSQLLVIGIVLYEQNDLCHTSFL